MGDAGPIVLSNENNTFYLLAVLNSKCVETVAELIAPTINFSNGVAGVIPVILSQDDTVVIENLTKGCVELSRADWDSFETSWDFQRHPLLPRRVDGEGKDGD